MSSGGLTLTEVWSDTKEESRLSIESAKSAKRCRSESCSKFHADAFIAANVVE